MVLEWVTIAYNAIFVKFGHRGASIWSGLYNLSQKVVFFWLLTG